MFLVEVWVWWVVLKVLFIYKFVIEVSCLVNFGLFFFFLE